MWSLIAHTNFSLPSCSLTSVLSFPEVAFMAQSNGLLSSSHLICQQNLPPLSIFSLKCNFLQSLLYPHCHKFSPTLLLSIHWPIIIFLKPPPSQAFCAILSNSKASRNCLCQLFSNPFSKQTSPLCFPLNIQLPSMPVYAMPPEFLKLGWFGTNFTISSPTTPTKSALFSLSEQCSLRCSKQKAGRECLSCSLLTAMSNEPPSPVVNPSLYRTQPFPEESHPTAPVSPV